MKKVIALSGYYDKVMKRRVTTGDEFVVTDERFAKLSTNDNDAGKALVKEKTSDIKKTTKEVRTEKKQ